MNHIPINIVQKINGWYTAVIYFYGRYNPYLARESEIEAYLDYVKLSQGYISDPNYIPDYDTGYSDNEDFLVFEDDEEVFEYLRKIFRERRMKNMKYPADIYVIDPANGDKFWFYDVENEDQVKNIQKMRYEIIEVKEAG